MTPDGPDLRERVGADRGRLLAVLERLDEEGWRTASLCAGWSVRELVVHMLMPYEASLPQFLAAMVRARFDFDRAADRWARRDHRSPAELLTALRATEGRKFNVPGSPPEAELSHLVLHAQDAYRPLGVPSPTDPDDARIVLGQVVHPRAGGLRPAGFLDGLRFTASDTEWSHGQGAEVAGPAAALLVTLAGRTAALDDLSGDGVALVRDRLRPGAVG